MESIDALAKAVNMFDGGLVLVSHDMRLISQVAKEIWVSVYKLFVCFGCLFDCLFVMHTYNQANAYLQFKIEVNMNLISSYIHFPFFLIAQQPSFSTFRYVTTKQSANTMVIFKTLKWT